MDNTQQAELARVLQRSEAEQTSFTHKLAFHRQTARDLLAAGYRKPRTITTAEDAASLPTGTLVRDSHAYLHERGEGGDWVDTDGNSFSAISLPATVLYEPAAGAAR